MVIVFIIFSHRFQNAGWESLLNVQLSSIMNSSARGREEVQSYVRSPTFPFSTGFYSHAQGAGLGNYMFQTSAASLAYSTSTSAKNIQQPLMMKPVTTVHDPTSQKAMTNADLAQTKNIVAAMGIIWRVQ